VDDDKLDAYWTLYECLTTLSKLMAPFVPFFAETIYQNLERSQSGEKVKESVHLCDWPAVREEWIDESLLEEMSLVREIVALGRSARAAEKIKTRQPLSEVELVLVNAEKAKILQGYIDLVQEELNVKSVKFVVEAREYVDYIIKPNFKAIGPKFGSLAPKIKQTLTTIDGGKARQELVTVGKFSLAVDGQTIELTSAEVEIGLQAHAGFAAAQGPDVLVVLKTEISEALRLEGLARELVHHIQQRRKEMDLAYEARIELVIDGPAELNSVIEQMGDYIKNETLTSKITISKIESVSASVSLVDVEGVQVKFEVKSV
jgi:isoleucyl-tRNA synthetase